MFLHSSVSTKPHYNTLQYISSSNAAIQYLGRWVSSVNGKWSAWSGSQIVFKVKNTLYLDVVADVLDPDATAITAVSYDIDNATPTSPVEYWTNAAATGTGLKTVRIIIPDNNEHTITLKTPGHNAYTYIQTSKATIAQFGIEGRGSLYSWTQGNKIIQCVGDSWMGGQNDWPRFMSTADYKLYPIGTGGLTCANMDTQYNYNYSGDLATTDSTAAAVIVSFGVNDFNASVTTASFETSMFSLYDKIRALQPTAKIFLVRVPSNIGASKDYGQYGPNMATVVAARTNCVYVNTTSLDATITWDADTNHLDGPGKLALAAFVKTQLIANGI